MQVLPGTVPTVKVVYIMQGSSFACILTAGKSLDSTGRQRPFGHTLRGDVKAILLMTKKIWARGPRLSVWLCPCNHGGEFIHRLHDLLSQHRIHGAPATRESDTLLVTTPSTPSKPV